MDMYDLRRLSGTLCTMKFFATDGMGVGGWLCISCFFAFLSSCCYPPVSVSITHTLTPAHCALRGADVFPLSFYTCYITCYTTSYQHGEREKASSGYRFGCLWLEVLMYESVDEKRTF